MPHNTGSSLDEQRPLLSSGSSSATLAVGGVAEPTAPTDVTPGSAPSKARLRLIVSALFILLASNLVAVLVDTAINQLTEGAACRQLHPEVVDWYNDPVCKSLDVQDRLALVMGWEASSSLIPGLLLAIPYGIFIDKYGPRAMMVLVALGGVITQSSYLVITQNPSIFDLRWIWGGAFIGSVVGGGSVGWQAMLFTVSNMIATENNRAEVIFYMYSFSTVCIILGGPLVYWAMRIGPVFTQSLGVFIFVIELALSFTLPGGLASGAPRKRSNENNEEDKSTWRAISQGLAASKDGLLGFGKLFSRNKQLGLLLISLMFSTIGLSQSLIRRQYATYRYGWSWAKAGLMVSVTSTATLIIMLVLVPFASRQLLKTRTAMGKDIWMARAGILSLALGSLLIGLARTSGQFIAALIFYMTDICYSPAITSIIAAMAGVDDLEKERTGSLYISVVFMNNIGGVAAGPILSSLLRVGMGHGGDWVGLPFLFEAALQLITICIVFSIRESRYRDFQREQEESSEEDTA